MLLAGSQLLQHTQTQKQIARWEASTSGSQHSVNYLLWLVPWYVKGYMHCYIIWAYRASMNGNNHSP